VRVASRRGVSRREPPPTVRLPQLLAVRRRLTPAAGHLQLPRIPQQRNPAASLPALAELPSQPQRRAREQRRGGCRLDRRGLVCAPLPLRGRILKLSRLRPHYRHRPCRQRDGGRSSQRLLSWRTTLRLSLHLRPRGSQQCCRLQTRRRERHGQASGPLPPLSVGRPQRVLRGLHPDGNRRLYGDGWSRPRASPPAPHRLTAADACGR